MRILVVSEVFPPQTGGSGRWLYELYRRFTAVDVNVIAGPEPASAPFDASSRLPITRLSSRFSNWGLIYPRGAWQYARATISAVRTVDRVRPDVTHAAKCLPEGLVALLIEKWRGVPFYCYAHGEELTLVRTSRELRWLADRVLRRARLIIANSWHTKQILVDTWRIAEAKVRVLHPGVDTSVFVPGARDERLRSRLGWSDRRVVMTVGALRRRKGQDTIIRALPAILARDPNVLYAVVGDGPERSQMENLAAEMGVAHAVQFRGVPDDGELVQLYQQCDVFALPNRQVGWDFEGFGIVFLEAQACGVPVIAGQSGGAPEALLPGATGELVDGTAPNAVAEAISDLLANPQRRMALGACGRQWVKDRFDWTVLAREAESLFADTPRG